MKWIKKGVIFSPIEGHSFCNIRVMCPTPFLMENRLRIFAGFCDKKGISRPGYIDVNPSNPSEIISISDKPLLDIGEDGMFDDNGLCPTSIVKYNNKIYMYYFAFQQGVKLPFYMFSGCAVSEDNATNFHRVKKVPILDRSENEPIMRSGPFVLYDEKDKKFKMWYPTGNKFIEINGKFVHTYVVKYIESNDGIIWPQEGKTVLAHIDKDEYGFGRPYVIKEKGIYRAFYSIRTKSKGYRLGYAESDDGINFTRKDEKIGIDISESGWDSEMQCYSAFFRYRNKTYLFYNGNNLGSTGIGYAELLEEQSD